MKKYTFFSLFAFLLTTGGNLFGQDYNDYNAPFFNGRLPSAKSEAMGRVQVSSYDGAFSAFYNPASIFLTKGLNSSFSYSSPYYMVRKANYNFYGLTYNFNKLGSISFSRFHFSYGEKFYMTSASDPADYSKSYTPTTSNYTLSYAKEFLSNFSIGINLNLYIDKYFNKSFKTYPVDIGLLKIISISHRNNNKQNKDLKLAPLSRSAGVGEGSGVRENYAKQHTNKNQRSLRSP